MIHNIRVLQWQYNLAICNSAEVVPIIWRWSATVFHWNSSYFIPCKYQKLILDAIRSTLEWLSWDWWYGLPLVIVNDWLGSWTSSNTLYLRIPFVAAKTVASHTCEVATQTLSIMWVLLSRYGAGRQLVCELCCSVSCVVLWVVTRCGAHANWGHYECSKVIKSVNCRWWVGDADDDNYHNM